MTWKSVVFVLITEYERLGKSLLDEVGAEKRLNQVPSKYKAFFVR